MSKVKQNCKWIPCKRLRTTHAGINFEVSDHPSLLAALRELSDYEDWIDQRLMPIVSKWIDENRERIIKGMSEEEKNDMGASVERAHSLLVEDGYIDERMVAMGSEDHPMERRNPLWQFETRRRVSHSK